MRLPGIDGPFSSWLIGAVLVNVPLYLPVPGWVQLPICLLGIWYLFTGVDLGSPRREPKPKRTNQPIYAFRAWSIDSYPSGSLTSLYSRTPWPPRAATVATCKTLRLFLLRQGSLSQHKGPAWGCTCGLYAMKNLHDVDSGYPYVVGIVELSGKVIEATRGYRAERARPVALVWTLAYAWSEAKKEIVRSAAARYEIPIIHAYEVDAFMNSLQPKKRKGRLANLWNRQKQSS